MGLIKAALAAGSTVLADQWKEYFYCDSIDSDVLIVKGQKRTSSKSSNTKGSDNIISNGSVIAVNEGQCMIIVEQGAIVDLCSEAGEYTYDKSTEPFGSTLTDIANSYNEQTPTYRWIFIAGDGTALTQVQREGVYNAMETFGAALLALES